LKSKKTRSTPDTTKKNMKTLYFPLLFMLVSLLQILQSSTYDIQMAKSKMFIKVEGLESIFKFFGEEMDEKAKQFPSIWGTFLKYDEERATFFQNLSCRQRKEKSASQVIHHKTLEDNIRDEVGKNPILVGLDKLLIDRCEKDGRTYLSRTGVVKSQNGYFIFRRSFAVNESRKQYFRNFSISKNDPYVFWVKYNTMGQNMYTNFWINADLRKYYKFYLTSETESNSAFTRVDFLNRDQYDLWKWNTNLTKVDVVLSAQEMFENDPYKILKRKWSQETASSTPQRHKSFSEISEKNDFEQCLEIIRTKKEADRKISVDFLPFEGFIKKSKLHKKYEELLNDDFGEFIKKSKLHKKYEKLLNDDFLHANPHLSPLNIERNAYYEVQRQKLLQLQKDINSLMFEEQEQNLTINPITQKDENSVLKESLSFIFFDDENLSQTEKDLEFQKLLCNENLKNENLNYD